MKRLFSAVLTLVVITFGFSFAPRPHRMTVIEEFTAAVHDVQREFPEVAGAVVDVEELSPLVYAVTKSTLGAEDFIGEVTFNEHWLDRELLKRSIDSDVELGFHPSLGHCTAAQFIGYHEAAHLVDAMEGLPARRAFADLFGDGHALHNILSGYSFLSGSTATPGLINTPEALAEAFAAVRCNGGNWAEKELNHMLETRGEV